MGPAGAAGPHPVVPAAWCARWAHFVSSSLVLCLSTPHQRLVRADGVVDEPTGGGAAAQAQRGGRGGGRGASLAVQARARWKGVLLWGSRRGRRQLGQPAEDRSGGGGGRRSPPPAAQWATTAAYRLLPAAAAAVQPPPPLPALPRPPPAASASFLPLPRLSLSRFCPHHLPPPPPSPSRRLCRGRRGCRQRPPSWKGRTQLVVQYSTEYTCIQGLRGGHWVEDRVV